MSSNLYRQALASLSVEEKEALRRCLDWLGEHDGSSMWPTNGGQILTNLQSEAHLVGDGGFGDSEELANFLRRCASHFTTSGLSDWHSGYEEVCKEFAGRGLRIPRAHLPNKLLRYTGSRALVKMLIQRILGIRARIAFEDEALSLQDAFRRIQDNWDPSRLDASDRLGGGREIFASFEHSAGAPRNDATALSQALALPFWQVPRSGLEILVELVYETDAVEDHRFPTVADAGWIHLFRPSSEEAPDSSRTASCCGWTEPLGSYPPQPEIVHDNAPLGILCKPPKFVGEIP